MPYQPIPVHDADTLNAMSATEYKSYEARLRRAVARQGHALEKSRARDPRAIDYNTYRIVNPRSNLVVAGGHPSDYGMGLDDVARWVRGEAD